MNKNVGEFRTVVIGAGLTGLSFSFHSPFETLILESESVPFGHARSFRFEDLWWDEGPHVSFSKNPYVCGLLREFSGLREFEPVLMAFFDGQIARHPVQLHINDLPSEIMEVVERDLQQVAERYGDATGQPANYREWLLQKFGPHLTEHFFARYTRKYWGVEPEELSTDWIAQRIAKPAAHTENNASWVPPQGHYLERVSYPTSGGFDRVYSFLLKGSNVLFDKRVIEIDAQEKYVETACGERFHFDLLVSTIPLPEFLRLLKGYSHPNGASLSWTGVTLHSHVFVGLPESNVSWGYVYDSEIAFSRFYQPHTLSAAPVGECFGIQTETYQLMQHDSSGSPPSFLGAEELPADYAFDLERLGLARQECLRGVDVRQCRYSNPVFDNGTANALDRIWRSLESHGVRREPDDTHPLSDWNESDIEEKKSLPLGPIVMGGRFAQWKYAWSDDCLNRGRELALRLNASLSRDHS